MPRRPSRRSRSLKVQPLTFSSFSRSLCYAAAACVSKRRMPCSRVQKRASHKTSDDALAKQRLKENKERSESSDEEEYDGVIQVDFVFRDPKDEDFHGVKMLLQSYLDDKVWDLSGFVDLILAQTTVGTIVKAEDDEDDVPYSVVTALNLGRYKDHRCFGEIKDFLLKVCPDNNMKGNLESFFSEKAQRVGLLVSQRVLNLPPQLFPPLYDALFDEVSWATEDEPMEELRNSFRFESYLLVSRVYKLKNAGQKKKTSRGDEEEMIYVKPEDEIFHSLSSWSFLFPLQNQPVMTQELRNHRLMGLVMAVQADKIPKFRKHLKSFVNEC